MVMSMKAKLKMSFVCELEFSETGCTLEEFEHVSTALKNGLAEAMLKDAIEYATDGECRISDLTYELTA